MTLLTAGLKSKAAGLVLKLKAILKASVVALKMHTKDRDLFSVLTEMHSLQMKEMVSESSVCGMRSHVGL